MFRHDSFWGPSGSQSRGPPRRPITPSAPLDTPQPHHTHTTGTQLAHDWHTTGTPHAWPQSNRLPRSRLQQRLASLSDTPRPPRACVIIDLISGLCVNSTPLYFQGDPSPPCKYCPLSFFISLSLLKGHKETPLLLPTSSVSY